MNSTVFKSAFDYAFLEVTEKAKDLFVQLNESGLELLVNVSAKVIGELAL